MFHLNVIQLSHEKAGVMSTVMQTLKSSSDRPIKRKQPQRLNPFQVSFSLQDSCMLCVGSVELYCIVQAHYMPAMAQTATPDCWRWFESDSSCALPLPCVVQTL